MTVTKEEPVADAKPDIRDFTPINPGTDWETGVENPEPEPKPESESEPEPESKTDPEATPGSHSKEDDFKLPDDDFGIDSPLPGLNPDAAVDPEPDTVDGRKAVNSSLRDQLRAANERAKKAEEDALKAIESSREAVAELESRLAVIDPHAHPKVQAIVRQWDKELDSMVRQISINGGDGALLKSEAADLVRQFQALGDPDSDGYAARRDALVSRIDRDFPDDRKEIVALMNKGASVLGEADAVMREIVKSGEDASTARANAVYEVLVDDYDDLDKTFFNPSQDMVENDPLNPRVLMAGMADKNPEVRDRMDKVRKFAKVALNPLPPVDPSEIKGMDAYDRDRYLKNRTERHAQAQRMVRATYAESRMAMTLLPLLAKELAEARATIAEFRDASPRPNASDVPEAEADNGADDDITKFDPGPVNIRLD